MTGIELKKAYDYLYSIGAVHSQKEFAEKIGRTPETISKVFKSDKKLSPSTAYRLHNAFLMISTKWCETGEGPMIAEKAQEAPKPNEMSNSSNDNISKLLEQNKELIDVLKKSLEESQRTNSILLNELSELRKGLTGVPSQKTELVESI